MDKYENEMRELYKRTLSPESRGDYRGLVCPSTFKEPCRLCELCKEVLFDKTLPREAPLRKRASSLNQKHRYYSNILVLPDYSTIVVFEYGDKIFNQLIQGQMDEQSEWKNFIHPTNGRNLFLSKIQGASVEQVDYKVEPRMAASQIKDPKVLKSLALPVYNLSEITALIDSGKVTTIYQSKLVPPTGKIEVRFLPSWLGPGTAKFFQKVNYHYNISKEEFAACISGKFDPVRMIKGVAESATSSITTPPEPTGVEWDVEFMDEEAPVEEAEQAGTNVADDDETAEIPHCYGQYDEENEECTTQCVVDGWGESCKFQYDEKKKQREKRIKAKSLSR